MDNLNIDRAKIQQEIVNDISRRGDIADGLNKGTVNIQGVPIDYHAFQLPDGTINIGRITGPR